MTVRPNDLMRKLTPQDEKEVDRLEKQIDAYLQERFDGDSVFVTCPDLTGRIKNEIFTRYAAAGWNIEYNCGDQHDGPYLIFKPQKISASDYYNK